MVVPNELVGDRVTVCDDCGRKLHMEALRSSAGYYLGFFCPNCGPYSRESDYYRTREDAEKALDSGSFERTD